MKTGPNGFPVQEDNAGNLVEMIEDEEWADDKITTVIVPMILRRADKIISAEYQKLWDKVWWNRHMARCPTCNARLAYGPGQRGINKSEFQEDGEITTGCAAARALIDRHGLEYLDPGEQVEWGITQGKMMALAWVHGSEWEGSGDT